MTDQTITTQASATVENPADTALIECCVIADADTISATRDTMEDRERTIRAALDESIDVPVEIQTLEFTLTETSELFAYEGDAQFRAEKRLGVECPPSAAIDVGQPVLDAGGTIEEIHFILDDTERTALEEEALVGALDRAIRKAERLASSEGLAISGIESITTRDDSCGFGSSIVDDALSSSWDGDFEPKSIVVEQSIEVRFTLTDSEDSAQRPRL